METPGAAETTLSRLGRSHTLNRSATAIWSLCDGCRSVEGVAGELERSLSLLPGSLLADVMQGILGLADFGLLRILEVPRASATPRLATRSLADVRHRDQIPDWCDAAGLVGSAVELGVRHGVYSNTLLSRSRFARLYSIDSWSERGYGEQDWQHAVRQLAAFAHRSEVVRMTFEAASGRFAAASLDLVYVDGFADAPAGSTRAILEDWWPKVRPRGVLAGHDFHAETWPGVVEAVGAFCASRSLGVHVTAEQPGKGHGPYPSWVVVRPGST